MSQMKPRPENVEFSESVFSVEGPTHLCRVDSKRGEFGRQSLDLCYDTWRKSVGLRSMAMFRAS
ncbi:hypothetical protein [Streptomyces asiaticus]|uniref:hypothetical protein n=1 Tax=Streptomyces asiaticus TaxID=114695 RepID=UPI00381681A3